MSSQDRLLAMLNSTSSPAHTPPAGSTPNPPPTSQQVSLQDLFRNITSPPPPPQQASQPPFPSSSFSPPGTSTGSNAANGNGNIHQAKLLSMLGGAANGASAPPAETPTGPISSTPSPLGTPGHQVNLLSLFKSPPPVAPAQEPIIHHPTNVLPPTRVDREASPRTFTSSSDRQSISSATAVARDGPDVASPQAAQAAQAASPGPSGTPQRSMFDFISPFDAFDKPSKPASPAPKQAQRAVSSAIPSVPSPSPRVQDKKAVVAAPPSNGSSQPAKAGVSKAVSAGPQKTAVNIDRQEQSSRSGSPARPDNSSGVKGDLGLVWQASKVAKDAEGKGPQAGCPSTAIIDLSEEGSQRLITAPDQVNVIPITLMKADSVEYKKGRSVGMTKKWLAYALSRGRVRLIDRASGAKLVLQLPETARDGSIIDIAVTSTRVAVIGSDHSITIFEVPEGWSQDDPPCRQVAQIRSSNNDSVAETDTVGPVFKLEWFKRDTRDCLAVGGPGGIVLFSPDEIDSECTVDALGEILQTDGDLVSFCFNQSNQAVGLISATHLTLYNASTAHRVWHRELPSSDPVAEACSVQFCEANIVVGRANNTVLDLVQIATDVADLSTIRFVAPPPSPSELNFGQVYYDPTRITLWIAPFSRGSLFAFRYALKGQVPVKEASTTRKGTVEAFDQVVEYPLDPVLSFVMGPTAVDDNPEIFFSTPTGLTQATINKSSLVSTANGQPGAVTAPAPAPPPAAPVEAPSTLPTTLKKGNVNGETNKRPPKAATPVKGGSKTGSPGANVKGDITLPSANDEAAADNAVFTTSTNPSTEPSMRASSSPDDLAKLLKKTEDRLSNNIKQQLSNHITSIGSKLDGGKSDSAVEIAAKVETQVKASLSTIISQEIKQNVIPAVSAATVNEIGKSTNGVVAGTVKNAMQSLPKDLERLLGPAITRALASTVQPALDRALQDALHQVVVPAITDTSLRLAEQITTEFKSEIVQMRKDYHQQDDSTALVLKSLLESTAELQKQVANLSEQLSRAQAHPLPPHPHPHESTPHRPDSPPRQPSATVSTRAGPPPTINWEDIFTAALHQQSDGAVLQLVNDYWGSTEQCLPGPNQSARSPLSQAVLLTILHRLAKAGPKVPPMDPMYSRVFLWARRAVYHLDLGDASIAGYIQHVTDAVFRDLQTFIDNVLCERYAADPELPTYIGQVRAVSGDLVMKMRSFRG